MKRLIPLFLGLLSISAYAQLSPAVEVGAGLALKHSEGFYIPRYTVSGVNLFKGIGLYGTYEHRSGVTFSDDFNGDGTYQRYIVGANLTMNANLYAFGGLSPIGPYGLGGSFGKVRKEVGLGLVFNPLTLRLGYSNWVGTTIGVHYRFGAKSNSTSYQGSKKRNRGTTLWANAKPRVDTVTIVDTVVLKEEVIKEVVREVEKPLELTLVATLYHQFNSTNYTAESMARMEDVVATLKANPSQTIVIIGHTDASGTEAYNYTLGLNRAQKLANYLVNEHGIPATQIEVRSEGKQTQKHSDDSAKNRRAEVYFKK